MMNPQWGVVTYRDGRYGFESEHDWGGGTQFESRAAKGKEFRGTSSSEAVYIAGSDFYQGG